jgi:DNA-binding NarL/FixJ family response regulator
MRGHDRSDYRLGMESAEGTSQEEVRRRILAEQEGGTAVLTLTTFDLNECPAPPANPPAELAELTPREVEVLTMVAKGLSNGEIAADLILSEATVKTHVKHILAKLDARDRVQAVVFAYEAGLVAPGG